MPNDHAAPNKKGQIESDNDLVRARARLARFSKSPTKGTSPQYGLVSKGGDARLQSSARERERYFDHIIRCFIDYCNIDSLSAALRQFVDESITSNFLKNSDSARETIPLKPQPIQSILLSLRKLRESLLSCERDTFTKKVYLLSIRIAANIGHYETYIPSILYLLQSPRSLSKQELTEIVLLLALHQAHYTDANSEALATLYKYSTDNRDWKANKTFAIIQAYIHKDYYAWISLYNSETDSCKHRMMQFGESKILTQMAVVFTQSYFSILLPAFEETFLPDDMVATSFIKNVKEASSWQIDDTTLVFRQRAGATSVVKMSSKKDAACNESRDNDIDLKGPTKKDSMKKNSPRKDPGRKDLARKESVKKHMMEK